MFWLVLYTFSLFLFYAGFAAFFSQKRQDMLIARGELLKLAVIAILPYFCLSVFVLDAVTFSADMQILSITAGCALIMSILYFSSKSKYVFKK